MRNALPQLNGKMREEDERSSSAPRLISSCKRWQLSMAPWAFPPHVFGLGVNCQTGAIQLHSMFRGARLVMNMEMCLLSIACTHIGKYMKNRHMHIQINRVTKPTQTHTITQIGVQNEVYTHWMWIRVCISIHTHTHASNLENLLNSFGNAKLLKHQFLWWGLRLQPLSGVIKSDSSPCYLPPSAHSYTRRHAEDL